MIILRKLIAFVNLAVLCSTLSFHFNDIGQYCDPWNLCVSDLQCVQKKCVQLKCSQDSQCQRGFQCRNQKCTTVTQKANEGAYCDQYTRCHGDNVQCIGKKCLPLNCAHREDCASKFNCQNGKCVAAVSYADQGQYCDQWTKCNNKDQCVGKKCIPLVCTRDPDCLVSYKCINGQCTQKRL